MKLINADDVKEMLESYRYHSFNLDDALHVIDEAPTVDTTEQEENAYNEGYAHGLETKRPQGEWYYNYLYGWHCSICNKSVKDMPTDNHKAVFNFCPNCGADMRGKNNAEQ